MRENAAIIFFGDGDRVHQVAQQIEDLIRTADCRLVLTKFSTRYLIVNPKIENGPAEQRTGGV